MACGLADFDNLDFDIQDFYVNTFVGRFVKWYRDLLPLYYKSEDTYKNSNDEGLLERYMLLFGEYTDTELIPQINCYLEIIDASVADERYLNHISDVLGNPPDAFNDIQQYRNLLTYIASVYKIKGTKRAYELFFSILGFNIEITEIEPEQFEENYDSERIYDEDRFQSLYDQGACQPCSGYTIKFSYKDTNITVFDYNILNALRASIEFNQPINAILEGLIFVVPLGDSMSITLTDDLEYVEERTPRYDSEHLYDDLLLYDRESAIAPEAMITHVKWEPLFMGGNLSLVSSFRTNLLPGFTYDLAQSYIKIQFRQGTIILNQILGSFIDPSTVVDYLETLAINESIPIPIGTDNIRLSGRIYISNDNFYSFNENITLETIEKFTNLYFNNF